ncbi:modular serine protease-like [Cylas formicarius]|uniref:modular serine protease-like n=1 Tax=Cylas formicarius TaxID=197179 RepID=UPI00295882A8|nr:modular serine protease-like [Cylas formicarius]
MRTAGCYCAIAVFVCGLGWGASVSGRIRRQWVWPQESHEVQQVAGNCTGGFQCKTTPDCIDPDKQCNGVEDCKDGSDEYENICKDIPCYGYLFKCAYGACIGGDQKCNGVKDCKDNSDEENCPVEKKGNIYCRSDQFECDNGQCIEVDGKCNGVADCEDKSDEAQSLCYNIYCPGYSFKCAYGACVDRDAPCNNVQDCLDNSDEDEKLCGPVVTPPVTPGGQDGASGGCTTPAQPTDGQWTRDNVKGTEGQRVGIGSLIKFTCNGGYRLSTVRDQEIVECKENGWSLTQMPHCEKLCPPYYSTKTTILKCTEAESGSEVPCDKATAGTRLTFKCSRFYEPPKGVKLNRYCLENGLWDGDRPECVVVCGEQRVTAIPLLVDGKEIEAGEFPWTIAIYRKSPSGSYRNICGGSMLTQNLVLTAGHCVTDSKGRPRDTAIYKIAAGKYYNRYMDERDNKTVEYADIKTILVNPQYGGSNQNYLGDMAILVLNRVIPLSQVIQPICYTNLAEMTVHYNDLGVVTGWGYTEADGVPSDTLKKLELPYTNIDECKATLPPVWVDRFFTYDKMCGGFYNKSRSVCKGDSGGAFAFENEFHRFYVIGIVSISHSYKKDTCNIEQNALFTRVADHANWLEYQVSQYSDLKS